MTYQLDQPYVVEISLSKANASKEIFQWLLERYDSDSYGWYSSSIPIVYFSFVNEDDAVLFKLTFGGK